MQRLKLDLHENDAKNKYICKLTIKLFTVFYHCISNQYTNVDFIVKFIINIRNTFRNNFMF